MNIKKILTIWFPRILMIIFVSFLVLLSFDVFSMDGSLLDKIGGFFMHNIPTIFLIIVLFYSWKKPRTGGIIFIIMSIIFTVYYGTYHRWDLFVLISLPLLLSGVLFLFNKDEHN